MPRSADVGTCLAAVARATPAGWISTRPAAATGRATRPGPEDLEVARAEGWIALPTAPLADLGG